MREICLCSWLLSASLFFHENCKPHIYNLLQGANKGSTEARRRQRYANIASRFEAGVINIHFNCTLLLGNYSSLIYLFVFRSSTGTITRSTKDVRTPNCLTVWWDNKVNLDLWTFDLFFRGWETRLSERRAGLHIFITSNISLIHLSDRHHHSAHTHTHTSLIYTQQMNTRTHSMCQESQFDGALSTANLATKHTPWQWWM